MVSLTIYYVYINISIKECIAFSILIFSFADTSYNYNLFLFANAYANSVPTSFLSKSILFPNNILIAYFSHLL